VLIVWRVGVTARAAAEEDVLPGATNDGAGTLDDAVAAAPQPHNIMIIRCAKVLYGRQSLVKRASQSNGTNALALGSAILTSSPSWSSSCTAVRSDERPTSRWRHDRAIVRSRPAALAARCRKQGASGWSTKVGLTREAPRGASSACPFGVARGRATSGAWLPEQIAPMRGLTCRMPACTLSVDLRGIDAVWMARRGIPLELASNVKLGPSTTATVAGSRRGQRCSSQRRSFRASQPVPASAPRSSVGSSRL
jgi:hypothetical protein